MVKTGQVWSGLVVTKDATGALATPSVGPVGALYVDGVANAAVVTISGSNPYKWTVTLPALTAGQTVSMYLTATIAAIATAGVVAEDIADTVRLSDLNTAIAVIDANVDAILAVDTSSSDATTAGSITRRRGDSWSISLTIGAITGYTSLWFTVKSSTDNLDSAAIVQIKLNASGLSDGLLYINGAAAANDALGSITVSDATTGAIVVALDETMTDDLTPGSYSYDVQTLISGAVTTPDSGTFTITADVTRSVL